MYKALSVRIDKIQYTFNLQRISPTTFLHHNIIEKRQMKNQEDRDKIWNRKPDSRPIQALH